MVDKETSEFPKKVRVTMTPDKEIEVGEQEYADLKHMGLLVDESANTTHKDGE